MPLVDERRADVAAIGALNTVLIRDGRTVGHNTDVTGFRRSFGDGLPGADRDEVVLLGAGGAGTAVAHALVASACDGCWSSTPTRPRPGPDGLAGWRQPRRSSSSRSPPAGSLRPSPRGGGLVNATPVGMAAHPGSPVPPELLRPDLWVADIVYRPLEHRAADRGPQRAAAPAERRGDGGPPGGGRLRALHRPVGRSRGDVPRLRRARRGRGRREGDPLGTHWRKEPMMAMRNLPRRTRRSTALAACAVALPLALCRLRWDDDEGGEGEESGGGDVRPPLAHSYTEDQPQHRCGAQVIADEVADADVGAHGRDLPREPARCRRRPDRVRGLRRHRHGHPGRLGPGRGLRARGRAGRGVRLRRQRPPGPLLRQRRLRRPAPGSRTRPACTRLVPGRPACGSSPPTSRSANPATSTVCGCGSPTRRSS